MTDRNSFIWLNESCPGAVDTSRVAKVRREPIMGKKILDDIPGSLLKF
jgi:hypothetical protein